MIKIIKYLDKTIYTNNRDLKNSLFSRFIIFNLRKMIYENSIKNIFFSIIKIYYSFASRQ
ncbi:hypothetical protein DSUL_60092 [Desulfovibrionales bacterium]